MVDISNFSTIIATFSISAILHYFKGWLKEMGIIIPSWVICMIGISGLIYVVIKETSRFYTKIKKLNYSKVQKDSTIINKEPLSQKSSNPFKKDKNIGWQINPKTGEVLCNKCLDEHGYAIDLDKDKSGISRICPRCKTVHILPFEMLSKEDFMNGSDIPITNRRPRKKAMRISTLK